MYGAGGGWLVADGGYVRTDVGGVPVVATPEEIDVTTGEQMRAALLEAASGAHPVVVVDMSKTLFCDSAGIHVLIRVQRHLVGEGRELRLVVSADGAVPRILSLTGLDRRLPCFASLEQALAAPPGAFTPPSGGSGPDQSGPPAGSLSPPGLR